MKLVLKILTLCLIMSQIALAQNEIQRSAAPGTDPNIDQMAPGEGGFEAGVPAVGCIDPSKGCYSHSVHVKRLTDSTTASRSGNTGNGSTGSSRDGSR